MTTTLEFYEPADGYVLGRVSCGNGLTASDFAARDIVAAWAKNHGNDPDGFLSHYRGWSNGYVSARVVDEPSLDKRAAQAELEACARQLSKGRAWHEWQPRSVDVETVVFLATRLDAGDDRKAAVAKALTRWVDTGGQVHEPGAEETEPPTEPTFEGDAAGWGGPPLMAHDANGIYRGGSGPAIGATKGAADPHDPNPVEAEHVLSQLLENYPEKAIRWVRKASWIGPVEVPVDRVDTDDEASWAASHQAARVQHFADQLEAGQAVKPAVCVQEPGENRVKVIDGHHRYLAAAQSGKKTFLAYVGFVKKNGGAWDETHVYQFHAGQDPANKGNGAPAFKVDTDPKATERLREYWARGEGAAKIGWGTPGDFDRCVLHVGKFMDDPQGYCAERHHDALGIWPATHAAELRGKKLLKGKKSDPPPAAAGLAVRAKDSGRVLMLQRGADDKDPAAGKWEFPGGRLEPGESALAAARREWGEETGLEPPNAGPVGAWTGSNGVYHGYVVEVPSESDLDVFGDREDVENPDGDAVEALAWWDPEDLSGNSVVRDELRADAHQVRGAMGALKAFGLSSHADVFTLLAAADRVGIVGNDVDSAVAEMYLKHGIATQAELLELLKFDPKEPRDPKGKWVHGLSELEHAVDSAAKKPAYHAAGGNVHAGMLSVKKDGTVVHKPTGTELGKIERVPVPGTNLNSYHTTHADGKVAYNGLNKKEALDALAAHHNVAFTEDHAPKLEAPKAPHAAAGAAVDAKDLTYKKDGSIVHGPSGKKLGTIVRVEDPANPKLRTYRTTHADGTQVYDGYKKTEALDALAKHHNYAVSAAAITPPGHAVTVPKPVEKPNVAAVTPTVSTPGAYQALGKVDEADVKSIGNQLVHAPSGVVLGTYGEHNGKVGITHPDGSVIHHGGGFTARQQLVAYHNAKYGKTVPEPVTKKPYETMGNVYTKDFNAVDDGNGSGHGQFIHAPTGLSVGAYETHDGVTTATHADGTVVADGPGQPLKSNLAVYHNSKYGDAILAPAPKVPAKKVAAAPPKKPYETVGLATEANSQQVWDAGEEFDVKKDGVVLGHVAFEPSDYEDEDEDAGGYWHVTHADGTEVGSEQKEHHAVEILLEHHNEKYGTPAAAAAAPMPLKPPKKVAVSPPEPVKPPTAPSAESWAKAGELKFGGATVDGQWNVTDKKTGTVLGHVTHKPSDGGTANWELTHGSGDKTTAKDLPTAINQFVALHNVQVGESDVSTVVPKDYHDVGQVKLSDVKYVDGQHVHTPTGTVLGVKAADGFTTHANGVTVATPQDGALTAQQKLVQYHNSKVDQGVIKPSVAAPSTPTELGEIKAHDLVQSGGKIMHAPSRTVVAQVGFAPDGSDHVFEITHNDGTKEQVNTSTEAKNFIADHHNAKINAQSTSTKPAVSEKPSWANAGTVKLSDVHTTPTEDGAIGVHHSATGTKIGQYTVMGIGDIDAQHADHTHVGDFAHGSDAVDAIVQAHNEKMMALDSPGAEEPPTWVQAGKIDNVTGTTLTSSMEVKAPNGQKIGALYHDPANGTYMGVHESGFGTEKKSTKIGAMNALVQAHNEKVDAWHAENATPSASTPSATAKEPYETLGTIGPNTVVSSNVGDATTLQAYHDGDYVHVGHVEPNGAGEYYGTHADGMTTAPKPTRSEAEDDLIAYHNSKYGGVPASMPSEPAKPYETVGKLNVSTVYQNNKGSTVEIHAFDGGSGTHVGNVVMGDNGTWTATHADGNVAMSANNFEAARNGLLDYHNLKYGTAVPVSAPSQPVATAVPTVKPAWHQTGAAVHPSDVVVKKDGSVVHKTTGHVLGTVTKPGDGTWKAEHADGTPFTYNSTRAVAVKKLLNYHNQTVAVQGAVKPGDKADWVEAGHLGQGYYNGPKLQPNGDVHAPNGKKIGHVSDPVVSDGTVTVTHESGATYQVTGGKQEAVTSLGHAHNQGVHLAEGTTPPKPASTTPYNAFAPKPVPAAEKQPYEKLGDVGAGSLHSANLQKDPAGKITGSDMTTGTGVVVGHTAANPDGTVKVTHADGHVVGESIKLGTGQVSGQLAAYHNSKYGDATLPKPPPPAPGHVVSAHTETLEPVTHEEKTALKQYTGSAYESINDKLRAAKLSAETKPTQKVPGLMHDGIEKSRLKQDTTLYRGIGGAGDKLFGPVGSHVGEDFTEYGFVSTSVHSDSAFGGTRLVIHAPKGTHAMDVKSFSNFGHENEVLLQHGTRFKINSDKMVGGQRVLDLTVTGP